MTIDTAMQSKLSSSLSAVTRVACYLRVSTGRQAESDLSTDSFIEVCGGKPQSVHIILKDVNKGDWAVGGELCSDLYPDPKPAGSN